MSWVRDLTGLSLFLNLFPPLLAHLASVILCISFTKSVEIVNAIKNSFVALSPCK